MLDVASRRGGAVLVLLAAVLLSACTEKARTLQVGAAQFEAEALTAIDTIDTMRRAELAPPPRTASAARDEFARNVLDLNQDVDPTVMPILVDPYTPDLAASEPEWQAFLDGLRGQYAAFAAIFDNLDQASFTARDIVGRAKPHAETLTAQMVAFARIVEADPPVFLQRRTAVIAEVNRVKADPGLSDELKAQRLRESYDHWLQIRADEQEMRRRVVEQCVKAANIGYEVRQQIEAYGDLSAADIADALSSALSFSESLTGQDLSRLRNRADTILNAIRTDPAWKAVADRVFREINAARDAVASPDAPALPAPTT